MLLREPFASLITSFRTGLIKFYHNSQRMSDFFYHITETTELNKEIKFQNKLISPRRSIIFWNFRVGIHRYSAFDL